MKRVVTAVALALLASTAVTTGTAAGQETGGTGTVKGKATLNKKAIPEATVVLKPGDASALENEPLTEKTSSKGTYKVTNVPPGTYKVELTTTVNPKKDRDSGAVGANVNCKIKGYSILSSLHSTSGDGYGFAAGELRRGGGHPEQARLGEGRRHQDSQRQHQVSVRDQRRRIGFLRLDRSRRGSKPAAIGTTGLTPVWRAGGATRRGARARTRIGRWKRPR